MKGKVKMIKAIKNFIDNNLFILLQLLKISLILAYSIFLIIFFSNKMKKTVEEKNNTIIEQNVIQNNEIKEVTNEISSENTRAEENTSETTSRSLEDNRTNIKKNITKSKTNTNKISVNNKNGYVKFTATGYCPCKKCCGKTTGITASGAKAKAGVTVAMPKNYKFGTKIEIKGMGTYIVQDRGGAIKNKKIDIFFNTHTEALKFGKKTVYLKIVK